MRFVVMTLKGSPSAGLVCFSSASFSCSWAGLENGVGWGWQGLRFSWILRAERGWAYWISAREWHPRYFFPLCCGAHPESQPLRRLRQENNKLEAKAVILQDFQNKIKRDRDMA